MDGRTGQSPQMSSSAAAPSPGQQQQQQPPQQQQTVVAGEPLMKAWATSALQLFSREFAELDELVASSDSAFAAEVDQVRELANAEVDAMMNRSGSAGGGGAGGGGGGRAKTGKGSRENADQAAIVASERERHVAERVDNAQRTRDQQTWHRMLVELDRKQREADAIVRPVQLREQAEYSYFSAHPPEFYSMEDILTKEHQAAPLPGTAGASAAQQQRQQQQQQQGASSADATAGGSAAGAATAGGKKKGSAAEAPAKRKKGRGTSGIASSSSTTAAPIAAAASSSTAAGALGSPPASRMASYADAVPNFIVDAVAFSERYNKELEREYGYRPMMRNALKDTSSGHTATGEDPEQLRSLLGTHRPGDGTAPPAFCVPNAASSTAGGAATGTRAVPSSADGTTARLPPLGTSPAAAADVPTGADAADRLTMSVDRATQSRKAYTARSSLPPAAGLGGSSSTSAATAAAAPGQKQKAPGKKRSAAAAAAASTAAANVKPPPPATTTRQRLAQAAPIDCTAKGRTLALSAYSGREATASVRFTNRQPHRTRLRVEPSTHPWLTYTCVHIAPVPGSTAGGGGSGSGKDRDGRAAPAPESPLTCGGYIEVEVRFRPADTSAPTFTDTLRIGYTRELNSRNAEGSQWEFFDVAVQCETILPSFQLYPSSNGGGDGAAAQRENDYVVTKSCDKRRPPSITACRFPYTFAMSSATLRYTLVNTGSACLVNVFSESPVFDVQTVRSGSGGSGTGGAAAAATTGPTTVSMAQGASVELAITFTPTDEGDIEADLIIAILEGQPGDGDALSDENNNTNNKDEGDSAGRRGKKRGAAVLAEHTFGLEGVGVVPTVRIVQIGDMTIAPGERPQWCLTDTEEGPPCYLAENTTPDLPTAFQVLVLNDSPIPLECYWLHEVTRASLSGEEADMVDAAVFSMTPSEGVLMPNATTAFTLAMTPRIARAVAAAWNLFVKGLPDPLTVAPDTLQYAPSDVVEFFTRERQIPAVADSAARADHYTDPLAAFQRRAAMQDATAVPDTFVTGFYVHSLPVPPSAVLIPPCLEETVDCLVGYENVRRVTLQNESPRPLRFYFDPTERETKGLCARAPPSPDVDITCHPRTGVVAPYDSVTITVRFTVLHVGSHYASVDCFIPEIMEGAAPGGGGACSHQLGVQVSGVGAVVHTSTNFLDFGLIELGQEAEASFTVTNDNPIPVVFDLQDPMLRDPPRFVFIPPNFRLGSGDSVEITVYRKAVSPEDAQTFFELVVRDGGATIAIETRATIQAPTMMLDDATVDFGVVPEGVWQERMFYVSNASALDVPFTVELASPSVKHVDLDYPTSSLLRAGQHHVGVPVRARFTYHPAQYHDPHCYRALLGLRSTRTSQILLVRVACAGVEQLKVAVDAAPLRLGLTPDGARQVYLPQPVAFGIADYLHNLLWNLVDEKVMRESNRAVQEGGRGDDEVIELPVRPPAASLRPLCGPVMLDVLLPDESPVFMEQVLVTVANLTGCESYYDVQALHYAPLDTISDMHAVDQDPGARRANQQTATAAAAAGPGTALARRPGHQVASDTRGSAAAAIANRASVSAAAATTVVTTSTQKRIAFNSGAESAVDWIDGERPVFWATADRERQERLRRAALAGAQSLLLDGRGCCTSLEFDATGALDPNQTLELPLTTLVNLPGLYKEVVRVQCGALPYVDIPLCCRVRGKPVLLDPTTSGLTTANGKDVLVMPPVIASVGTSRRGLIVMNRVPRDVDVRVDIFPCASTFCVMAVDDRVAANQVVLTLGPLPESHKRRWQETNGVAAVAPSTFLLPAMSSKEIVIEYTPELHVVRRVLAGMDAAAAKGYAHLTDQHTGIGGGGALPDEDEHEDDHVRLKASQEVDWLGSLVIHAEVTASPFNDAFLIDEFYAANAERYPSTRVVRQHLGKDDLAGTVAAMGSLTRSIPMLLVSRPLRTRVGTNIIRNNKILPPTEAEQFLVQRERARQQALDEASAAASATSPKADGGPRSADDDDAGRRVSLADSDIADAADDNNNPLLDAAAGALRPLPVLLAEEAERQELEAFLARRREEERLESAKYFMPIELLLRARCGVPRLAVQPSASGVLFPLFHHDQLCTRTVRLTNHNSATLYFTLTIDKPEYFSLAQVVLLPAQVDGDPLPESDDETRRALRELSKLKWGNITDRNRARDLIASGIEARGQPPSSAVAAVVPPEELAAMQVAVPMNAATGAAQTVYRLRGSDALDVVIDVLDPTTFLATAMVGRPAAVLEGALAIGIIDTSVRQQQQQQQQQSSAAASAHHSRQQSNVSLPPTTTPASRAQSAAGGKRAARLPQFRAPKQEQLVPLLVPFRRPVVRVSPALLWFRPGQTIHDGREQPSYARRLTLHNHSAESVEFELVEAGRQADAGLMRRTAATVVPGGSQKLTAERKIAHVVRMPERWATDAGDGLDLVEDSDHFVFSARRGVLPAATAGGEPGSVTVDVTFREHSDVRCECVFCVWVNGAPSDQRFILRGDSRETEV